MTHFGSVEEIREIEVGNVIASDEVRVAGHHEVTPLHQQILLSVAADHLRTHDRQTGVEGEHVADNRRVRALQRDGVGDLNHLIELRVGEDALAAFALNVETQNAKRGDVAPLADAFVVDDVVKEHIHFKTAPRGVLVRRDHPVGARRQLHPVRAVDLVVDHEAQHKGHVALVSLAAQYPRPTYLHSVVNHALGASYQRRHRHVQLKE